MKYIRHNRIGLFLQAISFVLFLFLVVAFIGKADVDSATSAVENTHFERPTIEYEALPEISPVVPEFDEDWIVSENHRYIGISCETSSLMEANNRARHTSLELSKSYLEIRFLCMQINLYCKHYSPRSEDSYIS